jgi:hypothetical protein
MGLFYLEAKYIAMIAQLYGSAGTIIPLQSPNPTRPVFISPPPQAVKLISSPSSTKDRRFPCGVVIAWVLFFVFSISEQ